MFSDGQLRASGTLRLSCWAYFCNIYDEADLNSPHYDDYDSYADHGMEYDIRYGTCIVVFSSRRNKILK